MGDVGHDRGGGANTVFFRLRNDSSTYLTTVITASATILPLALIPLSFGHSVVRYRLMDVDVVVRRAFVYALTTVTIAMMIGAVALGLVFLASETTCPIRR